MKTRVDLYVPIERPAPLVRDACFGLKANIEQGRAPYDKLAMRVALRDVRLGLEGHMSVPVEMEFGVRRLRWECAIAIRPAHDPNLYPTFEGTLSIVPSTNDSSELWLQGTYEPPLGRAGAIIDATVLKGVAERSLHSFVAWLGDELTSMVDGNERRSRESAMSGLQPPA